MFSVSRRHITVAIAAIGALVTFATSGAQAYSWRTCDGDRLRWNRQWTNMYISTTSFPPSSTWDARLQNAMWHWNNAAGSRFAYYFGRDTDGSHRSGNGRNEVYLDSGLAWTTLGVTRTRYHCYWFFGWHHGIDETDVGFNSDRTWNLGIFDYVDDLGGVINFESVALHELGHALGLLHENRWMATMNASYPNSGPLGTIREWDPLADDRNGVRFLYPTNTNETDIAGSVFRRTGSGTSDLVGSTPSTVPGSTVTIGFTFSNLSTERVTFDIDFYLSTNDYISTFDRLIGTNNGAWADPGATGTYSRTLYIPSDIAPGTYWIGFLVDSDSGLAEANEVNNRMAMPRVLRVD